MWNVQNEPGTGNNPPGYRLSVIIHYIVWAVIVFMVTKQVLLPALNTISFGIWHNNGGLRIIDFPFTFNFTKAFWLEERPMGISIYSAANHLQVIRGWIGMDAEHSLTFGYTPTMLLILSPLVLLSPAIAYCVFNGAGLLAVWWQTRPVRCRLGLGLLSFISPLSMLCFFMGQNSFITGAGLLFLYERSRSGFEKLSHRQAILSTLLLWALTAKPPIALTVGVVLLGMRQWRPVLFAALLTLATTLAISPLLGSGWADDYIQLITTYNRVLADPVFTSGHYPKHMANLVGVLSVDFNLPDDIASRISSFIWLGALAGLVVLGPRLRLSVGGFWSIGVLLYLLFCPHVSSYEVLQVILLVPFCIPALSEKLHWKELTLLCMVFFLPFASPVQSDNRIILFSGLLFLLGFVGILWRKKTLNCAALT